MFKPKLVVPWNETVYDGRKTTFTCYLKKAVWEFITNDTTYKLRISDEFIFTFKDNISILEVIKAKKRLEGEYRCITEVVDNTIYWSSAYLYVKERPGMFYY